MQKGFSKALVILVFIGCVAGCTTQPQRATTSSETVVSAVAGAPIETGEQVLKHIRDRYSQSVGQCVDDNNAPAFVCSGILLRSSTYPTGKRFAWMPNPNSTEAEGVSVSWLRQDSNFWNPFPSSNGFIIYPKHWSAKYGLTSLRVRCAFPQDAWSQPPDRCTWMEKTAPPTQPRVNRPLCHLQKPKPIWTGQEWKDAGFYDDTYQCAFGLEKDGVMVDTAQAFMAMVAARLLLGTNNRNELIFVDWRKTDPAAFPIEAFFYQNGKAEPGYQDPLTNAKADQCIYEELTKRRVPLIRWNMNRSGLQTFDYIVGDQATAADCRSLVLRWRDSADRP